MKQEVMKRAVAEGRAIGLAVSSCRERAEGLSNWPEASGLALHSTQHRLLWRLIPRLLPTDLFLPLFSQPRWGASLGQVPRSGGEACVESSWATTPGPWSCSLEALNLGRYLQGRARTCSLELARFWLFRGPASCHPNTGTRDKGLIPTEGDCGTDCGQAQ